MKASHDDREKYSDAIDRIQEGYDIMVELFNEMEDDDPLVNFDDDLVERIEKAKVKFGDHEVDKKINTVCREMLSWLDLDDVEADKGQTDPEET